MPLPIKRPAPNYLIDAIGKLSQWPMLSNTFVLLRLVNCRQMVHALDSMIGQERITQSVNMMHLVSVLPLNQQDWSKQLVLHTHYISLHGIPQPISVLCAMLQLSLQTIPQPQMTPTPPFMESCIICSIWCPYIPLCDQYIRILYLLLMKINDYLY